MHPVQPAAPKREAIKQVEMPATSLSTAISACHRPILSTVPCLWAAQKGVPWPQEHTPLGSLCCLPQQLWLCHAPNSACVVKTTNARPSVDFHCPNLLTRAAPSMLSFCKLMYFKLATFDNHAATK